MTRGEDVESFLDAGSGGGLITEELSDYELELLGVAGREGGDLSIVVLDRTTVPGSMCNSW